MSQPAALYRNILEIANDGRGDGTIVAYGTSASVDQSNKQFDLTTINVAADFTEADDFVNGMHLVFTSSGRSYLITDYAASSDVATVYTTPNAEDTGDWTIRKKLYTDDFDTSYPVSNVCDGRLYTKWKDGAANNTAILRAFMPNDVDDGGFESGTLDAWTTSINGDGSISINPTSPILGTYDCLIDMGTTATTGKLYQAGKIDLKAGRTYGVVFKARHSGAGTVEWKLEVRLTYYEYKPIEFTWTKINSEDSLLGDDGLNNRWFPDISDTAAWEEATFQVQEDLDAGDWNLRFNWNTGPGDPPVEDLYIDEIYLFEVIQPDTLILAGHNAAGGFTASSYLAGYRCDPARSSIAAADYDLTLLDLDADVTVAGNSPVYETFTAPTAIYPCYVLQLDGISGKTWEAGEVALGERWTWDNYPNPPLHAKSRTIEAVSSKARGGPKVVAKLYEQRRLTGTVEVVDSTEIDNWVDFVQEVGYGKPFFLRVQAMTNLGTDAETLLVSCAEVPDIDADPPIYYRITFEFEEAF